MTLEPIDWVIIAGYFLLLLGVAWWVIARQKDTATDFFLAGRHLPWFLVGASIFASNIGSEHVVGLAGSGATDGVAMAHYELHAWCLLVLAWVFIPFYMRSMVYTMPEFLERRFSTASRYILSIISLVLYIISKVAVGIFAGGVVFSALLPNLGFYIGSYHVDSFWIGSVMVLVLTGLYTMLGGMRAVVYTEALQTIVLVIGSVLITYFGMKEVGGWQELRNIVHTEGDPAGYVEKIQSLEAAVAQGRRMHLGSGDRQRRGRQRDQAGLVFQSQRPLPLDRHADLRAGHRPLVLVHVPVHRAAGAGCEE